MIFISPTASRKDAVLSIPSRQVVNIRGSGRTGHHIVQQDVARFRALLGLNEPAESTSLPPNHTNGGAFGVAMDVQIGDGNYTILVDSGSSNTWIGANRVSNPYHPSDQSRDLGRNFNISYGSGNVTGSLFTDKMKLPGVLSSFDQTFGVANASSGFDGYDGLMGIGPVNLTLNTVQLHHSEEIPTPPDNMLMERIIQKNITGVFLPPVDKALPGRFDFGGVNTKGLTTSINYVPNLDRKDTVLGNFYSFNQTIRYGEEDGVMIFDGPAVIDTGSTLLGMTPASFQNYMRATNAIMDDNTGLLRVDEPESLKSLYFQIGDIHYEFTPDAQTWPKEFNTDIGGVANATYLIVSNLGFLQDNSSFPEVFSINGMYWMSRYYLVFDSSGGQRRVGVAETIFSKSAK